MSNKSTTVTSLSRWLGRLGSLLVLQLMFFMSSLPVVTAVPAAVALQVTLSDALADEAAHVLVARFFRTFGRAAIRLWLWAIAAPVVAALFLGSALFWGSTRGPLGLVALALLFMLFGLALAVYVGALARAGLDEAAWSRRQLIREALQILGRRPLRCAACVVFMMTWLVLLARLPTLSLVGSGLVPALLARWLAVPRASAAIASTSS